MPTLPEIAINLGVGLATIWIGGAVVIGGVDRVRAHLRHRHPVLRPREPDHWSPGSAQDL